MKNIVLFISSLLLTLTLVAQDEVRKLESFDALDVSGGFDVSVFEGSPRAEITINKGELEGVKMSIKNGELYINYKLKNSSWGWNNGNHNIDIDLYVPNLESISTSAGADVYGEYKFTSEDFEADASSGSKISIEIEAGNTEVDVSSGAAVEIEGITKTLEVDISSGAAFNGKKLEAERVEVDASSGASAKVWATKRITADASSGASVKYKGDPEKTDLDPGKWSGGSIKRM